MSFLTIQNFLSDFESFRAICDNLDYEGVTNPADGVFYPGVSLSIPADIQAEVKQKIEGHLGCPIVVNAMFVRLSKTGTYAPHQAHTDIVMGQKSFMLYLNRQADCLGGTALVKHESGMDRTPTDLDSFNLWQEDHSSPDKWTVEEMCDMEQNKACIFDANLMHRAHPIGGFGHDNRTGRLVLTAFFNEVH